MKRSVDWARRRFLQAISTSVPAAVLGLGTDKVSGSERGGVSLRDEVGSQSAQSIDLGYIAAGDGAIQFRKHILDLGSAESVTVVDVEELHAESANKSST